MRTFAAKGAVQYHSDLLLLRAVAAFSQFLRGAA